MLDASLRAGDVSMKTTGLLREYHGHFGPAPYSFDVAVIHLTRAGTTVRSFKKGF
jgi:hypothetical protein